jgi:hypothetical protein
MLSRNLSYRWSWEEAGEGVTRTEGMDLSQVHIFVSLVYLNVSLKKSHLMEGEGGTVVCDEDAFFSRSMSGLWTKKTVKRGFHVIPMVEWKCTRFLFTPEVFTGCLF